MDTAEVVSTLEDLGMLDYEQNGPWPGEPEVDDDVFEIDWASVNADGESWLSTADRNGAAGQWNPIASELRDRASGAPHLPPPDVFDALAWYLPIHYYGTGWAIYIREDAIVTLAGSILSYGRFPQSRLANLDVVWGSVRAALGILFLHEMFHHKVESLAIRLEVITHAKRYRPYDRAVYSQLRGTNGLLEEALACAESWRRLNREKVYKRSIPPDVLNATNLMLEPWLQSLPKGYELGYKFRTNPEFNKHRDLLACQVDEAKIHPLRRPDEWKLVPQSYRGLFDCLTATHIIVPIGTKPVVPWFSARARPAAISTRKMQKLLSAAGFEARSGGKGSHVKMVKEGSMVILPANREALSAGVISNVAKTLGYSSVAEFFSEVSA